MTKKEAIRQTEQENRLLELGFTRTEAEQLRRISIRLQRWYELECGDGNEHGSWAIERDDNGDGPPYMVHHHYGHGRFPDHTTRTRIADREAGAKRRLDKIIKARNERSVNGHETAVSAYLQTDPRGAALYILRPGDVPEGREAAAYYNRGICVY